MKKMKSCLSGYIGIVNAANTIINQAENRDDIDWSGGSKSES